MENRRRLNKTTEELINVLSCGVKKEGKPVNTHLTLVEA